MVSFTVAISFVCVVGCFKRFSELTLQQLVPVNINGFAPPLTGIGGEPISFYDRFCSIKVCNLLPFDNDPFLPETGGPALLNFNVAFEAPVETTRCQKRLPGN